MGYQQNQVLQALLGHLGNLGVDPGALAAMQQRQAIQDARDEQHRSKGRLGGFAKTAEFFNPATLPAAVTGEYAGMASGRSPGQGSQAVLSSTPARFQDLGTDPVYGSMSQGAAYRSGLSSPRALGQVLGGENYLPIMGSAQGVIDKSGQVSPTGLGRFGLDTLLTSAGLAMAGPIATAGGAVGGQAGSRIGPRLSNSPYAATVGGALGAGVGGGIGGAMSPEMPGMTGFGKWLSAPSSFIPQMAGQGAVPAFVNSTMQHLPNVGSVSQSLVSGLNAKRDMRTQRVAAQAAAPQPAFTGLFGGSRLPTLGSLL